MAGKGEDVLVIDVDVGIVKVDGGWAGDNKVMLEEEGVYML